MAAADYESSNNDLADDLGRDWQEDTWGQQLLFLSLYDMDLGADLRHNAYEAFIGYMMDEYGMDFENWFDWDAYREWYG